MECLRKSEAQFKFQDVGYRDPPQPCEDDDNLLTRQKSKRSFFLRPSSTPGDLSPASDPGDVALDRRARPACRQAGMTLTRGKVDHAETAAPSFVIYHFVMVIPTAIKSDYKVNVMREGSPDIGALPDSKVLFNFQEVICGQQLAQFSQLDISAATYCISRRKSKRSFFSSNFFNAGRSLARECQVDLAEGPRARDDEAAK